MIANATTKVAYPLENDILDEVDGILIFAQNRRPLEIKVQVVLHQLNLRCH